MKIAPIFFKMKTEFNLSENISQVCPNTTECILIDDVKKFIILDTELINQFACGNITLLELKQKRTNLAGDKLK